MLMCSRQTFVATNVHPQMTTAASKSTWVTERNRLEFTRIAMNWNTYPTAMADSSSLLERCKLLTRWAFEYFNQTAGY